MTEIWVESKENSSHNFFSTTLLFYKLRKKAKRRWRKQKIDQESKHCRRKSKLFRPRTEKNENEDTTTENISKSNKSNNDPDELDKTTTDKKRIKRKGLKTKKF